MNFRAAFLALRPYQWVKNLLIAVPALAAHTFGWPAAQAVALGFCALCLAASASYLINDVVDREHDRAHPRKRTRAIAAGALAPVPALVIAFALLAGAALIAFNLPATFALTLAAYFALTSLYSLALRALPLVDVIALALLYGLRVVAGAAVLGIALSDWLIAFSFFCFMALALIKRCAELSGAAGQQTSPVSGRAYRPRSHNALLILAAVVGGAALVVMGFYLSTPTVRALYAHPLPLWGAWAVLLFWIARLLLLTRQGRMHDDPVAFALTDWPSLLCGAAIVGLYALSL